MQNLYKILEQLLKSDARFVSKDGRDILLKNLIQQKASEMDVELIKLLLSDESLKKHFFSEIEDMLIFDKAKFVEFIYNKEFLPDSYTAFANNIWLMDDKDFMKEQKKVVLARPYKDCILEWWQDKEDAKRNEVFHNMTLAPDQITRLLKPKVLTNREHYSTDGEKRLTAKDVKNLDFSKENLIIKWNNLLVLHSLKERFAGRVKLIYIDPPYNTWNDGFWYNDNFNHSTWLTFMKNRIEVAKELLSTDWVILVQIDYIENAYLKILMDEIFGKDKSLPPITVKTSTPAGFKVINPGLVNVSETILIYCKWDKKTAFKDWYVKSDYQKDYNKVIINIDEDSKKRQIQSIKDVVISKLWFDNSDQIVEKYGKKTAQNIIQKEIEEFAITNATRVFATYWPHKPSNRLLEWIERSKKNPDSIVSVQKESWEEHYLLNGRLLAFYSNKLQKLDWEITPTQRMTDFWDDLSWDALSNEGWVTLKNGKKPEALLKRIIELTTEKGDIILDYHWWSGTSWAVAHKMWRQRILVEQMDYIKELPQQRLKNVIDWDTTWISKLVWWQWWWSFVYTELKTRNQSILDRINSSSESQDLINIRNEMREWGFLSVKVDVKKFDEYYDTFVDLSVEDKKAVLIESLDKNMLYVPVWEIDDAKYQISDDDKALTNAFYNRTEK